MPWSRCASASARASPRSLSGCTRGARSPGSPGLRTVRSGLPAVRRAGSLPRPPGCALVGVGQLVEDLALFVDIALRHLLDADQRIARLGGDPDQLVEL